MKKRKVLPKRHFFLEETLPDEIKDEVEEFLETAKLAEETVVDAIYKFLSETAGHQPGPSELELVESEGGHSAILWTFPSGITVAIEIRGGLSITEEHLADLLKRLDMEQRKN